MKYRFSPTQLNLFNDSPLDFWLDRKFKCARPRGIFPSLPSGMDRIIKNYFDQHRSAGTVPPELDAPVFLYKDQEKLDLWRNWRTGLEVEIPEANARLGGAVDDLLTTEDGGGLHIPFDYKTKGSPTTVEDTIRYYKNQVDCYGLMLQESGLPVADFALFSYWSPDEVHNHGGDGNVHFNVQTIRIEIDPECARQTIIRAAACLDSGTPPPDDNSEYLLYFRNRQEIMKLIGSC